VTSALASRKPRQTWRRCSATVSSRGRVGQAEAAVAQDAGAGSQSDRRLAAHRAAGQQNVVSQQPLLRGASGRSAAEAQRCCAQAMLVGADARVAAARATRDQAGAAALVYADHGPGERLCFEESRGAWPIGATRPPLMTVVPLRCVVTANLKVNR